MTRKEVEAGQKKLNEIVKKHIKELEKELKEL